MTQQRIIVVLGMHRSGTSLLTRSLQTLGVNLGNHHLPPAADNEKGFWEDADINQLNINILESIHVNWDDLPSITAEKIHNLEHSRFMVEAVDLLRSKVEPNTCFGLKDPRICTLLPFWNIVFHHCNYHVDYIIGIRNPIAVADSLEIRNNFQPEKTHLLWLQSVLASLLNTSSEERVIVDYDLMLQNPKKQLQRIAKGLDLNLDPKQFSTFKDEFVDPNLRHNQHQLADLEISYACPPIVREVYTYLSHVTRDAKTDDKNLKRRVATWAKEVRRMNSALILATRLTNQVHVLEQKNDQKNDQHEELIKAFEAKEQQFQNIQNLLLEKDKTVVDLTTHINSRNQTITEREQSLALKEKAISELRSKLDNFETETQATHSELELLKQLSAEQDGEIKGYRTQLERQELQAQQTAVELHQLRDNLDAQSITNEVLQEKLNTQDAQIQEMVEQRADITFLLNEKTSLENEIARSILDVNFWKEKIVLRDDQITELRQDIDRQQRINIELDASFQHQSEVIKRQTNRINSLEKSTSWRLTLPIRIVGTVIKTIAWKTAISIRYILLLPVALWRWGPVDLIRRTYFTYTNEGLRGVLSKADSLKAMHHNDKLSRIKKQECSD